MLHCGGGGSFLDVAFGDRTVVVSKIGCIYIRHHDIHDPAFPAGKTSNGAMTRRVGPLMGFFCVGVDSAMGKQRHPVPGSASGVASVEKSTALQVELNW